MLKFMLIVMALPLIAVRAEAGGHGHQHGMQMHHTEPQIHKPNKSKTTRKARSYKHSRDAVPGKGPGDARKVEPLPDGGRIDDPIAGGAGDRPDQDDQQP